MCLKATEQFAACMRPFGAMNPHQPQDWLLQLPDAALLCVLQQLDPCSLACTAVTCSKLRHAVPASMSQLVVQYNGKKEYGKSCELQVVGWAAPYGLDLPHTAQLDL
jgi:hypothetical protein